MGKIIDAIERAVFGATAQERVDMLTTLAARRVEQRIVAALDTDPARQCEACGGDGYVLNGNGPDEVICVVCHGVGLKSEGNGHE